MLETLYVIILIFAIFALYQLFKSSRTQSNDDFPYIKQQYIFSKAERSFYSVLMQAIPPGHVVLGKIRIADVIKPKKGLDRSSWQRAFNKVSAKHLDYIICTSTDYEIVAAVELDDSSHNSKKRMARDAFVNSAMKAANLPLIRFQAKRAYSLQDVREALNLIPPEISKDVIL